MEEPRIGINYISEEIVAALADLCAAHRDMTDLKSAMPPEATTLDEQRNAINRTRDLLRSAIVNKILDCVYVYDDAPVHLSRKELNALRRMAPR